MHAHMLALLIYINSHKEKILHLFEVFKFASNVSGIIFLRTSYEENKRGVRKRGADTIFSIRRWNEKLRFGRV